MIVSILDYKMGNSSFVLRALFKNNIEWKDYGGKHEESKITALWQTYVMPKKFNMHYRRATYSSQIVTGQITR